MWQRRSCSSGATLHSCGGEEFQSVHLQGLGNFGRPTGGDSTSSRGKKTSESCRIEHPACQQGFPPQAGKSQEVRRELIRAGGRSQPLASFTWSKHGTGKEDRRCKERDNLSLTPKPAIPAALPHHNQDAVHTKCSVIN